MAAGKCPLGNVLPNARLVSSKFHRDANLPAPRLTQLFTIFSQFVDHDITLSAAYNVPDCCTDSSDTEKCAPITVSNDPFYSAGKCLSFARSLVFCEELGCTTDPTNALSAYVDASQVYGSDAASALALRSLSGGKLATSAGSLLPIIDGAFKGGDIRALENPALGSLQTVFLREHNRIATLIQKKFPLWSDEKIYQHTRRIVTAEYQNIAFGEMLPLILGTDRILPMNAMSTQYNPNMDASLLNEFSTAAYRFGHTLLNGNFNRNDPSNGSPLDSYLLRFNFNNDTLYKENADRGMTSILKGLAGQSAQSFDQFMTKEVTQFLFSKQSDNFLFGEDLASRNIQRGRDHSIQPWLSYRVFCGFPTPDDWNIRPQEISPEKWTTLQSLYLRVADIDLFTGGLAEVPVPGGTVGVTFACIIGEQFKRLLSGDRFFLTHSNNVGIQMLDHQVNAIRNVKLSDIICLTSSIRDIQRRVFEIPSPPLGPNPLVPCSNAFSLDMNRFYGEKLYKFLYRPSRIDIHLLLK
jgi:peroxidase